MTHPAQLAAWLAHVAHAPTWTGWRTMQTLAQHTGYWNP